MSQLGDILTELRKDRGLTQKKLAKELNTSSSSISSYETGARLPNIFTVVGYSKLFDVTTDYILGETTTDVSPSVLTDEFFAGDSFGALLNTIKGLSTKQKEAIALVVSDMRFSHDLRGDIEQRGVREK